MAERSTGSCIDEMRGVDRRHYVAQAYDGFAKCVMSCLQRSPGRITTFLRAAIDRAPATVPVIRIDCSVVVCLW